ncbi:MAG TPA: hypothetical protein GXZ47_06030, partial [Treponema sp.]|nr:hypothetical protein [Treponema sp.]
MKKTIFLTLTAAVIIPLLILSCGMGLEPAKSGETTVSLSFASLPGFEPMASSGRAIFPGGGSLYIKMEGGSATEGYYGPYTVSNSGSATITITEIPSGSYDAMILLYTPVTGLSEEFVKQIFSEDEEFYEEEGIAGSLEINGPDVLFLSKSSIGFVEGCVIREGRKNSFPVTMLPITPAVVTPSGTLDSIYGSPATLFNGFIRLSGLAEPFADIAKMAEILPFLPTAKNFQVKTQIYNNHNDSMTLTNIAFYDGTGKLIAMPSFSSVVVNSGATKTFDVPYQAGDEIFMYLNVSGGGPNVSIKPTIGNLKGFTPITATLGISAHGDKFDTVESVVFSQYDPTELPKSIVGVALAKGSVDSSALTGFLNTTWLDKKLHLTI